MTYPSQALEIVESFPVFHHSGNDDELDCSHHSVLSTSADTSLPTVYTEENSTRSLKFLGNGLDDQTWPVRGVKCSGSDPHLFDYLFVDQKCGASTVDLVDPARADNFFECYEPSPKEPLEPDYPILEFRFLDPNDEAAALDSALPFLPSALNGVYEPSDSTRSFQVIERDVKIQMRRTFFNGCHELSSNSLECNFQSAYTNGIKLLLSPSNSNHFREKDCGLSEIIANKDDDCETIFSVGSAFSLDILAV
jgi:hypothetical protein